MWQSEALCYSPQRVGSNLGIGESTVRRIVHLFQSTGDVARRPYPIESSFRVITEPVKIFIVHLILQRPGILLREITDEIKATFGLDVTESATCKVMKKIGLSRQKLALFALQRDESLRNQFVTDVSLYHRQSLIFIDETGTDSKDTIRMYGYSIRGKPVKVQKLLVRGERISVITAMSMEGIIAMKIVRGGVNGDAFYEFICNNLVQHLMPFNSTNKHSVVVLDNCSIHHVDEVRELLNDTSVLTQFLPPYSPDYNPIELAFSKVKYMIRSMEMEMQAIDDIETIVLSAFSTITVSDCQAWINSIGIY